MRRTFRPPNHSPDWVFTGSDMNLYYDVSHPNWYKRPDWFAVVGVPRLYDGRDLRMSYVIWQEGIRPFVVVELLSPGTEDEDLGQTARGAGEPPTKWEVYERILGVPYYVLFNRYTNQLRAFVLQADFYQELQLSEPKIWMPGIELGLGLWLGEYQGIHRLWLRWYDAGGNWIPTAEEREALAGQLALAADQRAEAERQRAEQAQAQLEALQRRLRELGIDPDSSGEG